MDVEPAELLTGEVLLVAGYDTAAPDADDPRLPLVTQLGAAILASASQWRVRRLAARGHERDSPSRSNVRREIVALLERPVAARILVITAELTRTVEGLAVLCTPIRGGFQEDGSVSLEWIAHRLRASGAVPTALVIAAQGAPRDARSCLDVLGPAGPEHVIAVDAGEPLAALGGVIDGLWSEAIDLATGTVTPRSLGAYLGRRLPGAAILPSTSMRTLLAPRGLARADLAERAHQRASEAGGAGEAVDELIGAILPGQFQIAAEIGRGNFGVVYRAHQQVVDREVAVKVLPAQLGVDAIRRFALEIRAVGRLDHKNVVRVWHADVTRDGRMFVAMELLSGPTLEALLAEGPLPPARALALVRQLAAGLAAAHAAGIVHADVKPANAIVVDAGGGEPRLVLLDFGLACLRAEGGAAPVGGTPAFMAPEQLRGERIDAGADLYAAAVVSLALVAGAPPRTEAEREAALARFSDEPVQAALRRALAEDPAARFASAVELAEALSGEASGALALARPARPPFRLAAPFSEEDRADFHGRGPEVERLLEHVLFRRAVVYVAPSGTGKTSLLRAGLVPRLRDLDIDVVYLACRAGVGADLAGAVAQRLAAPSSRRLVLVIDQIEAALPGGRDDARGEALFEGLGMPAWSVDAPVSVVWSVREEYLARLLDRVLPLEPGVPIVRLGPLAPAAAGYILSRTLEHRGVAVEPALVELLVRDLTGAAAGLAAELGWGDAPAIYPPHLQLAGAVLHEARAGGAIDLALYRRVGGLATILAEHLHRVLEGELGGADTSIARDVLLALVTASHTRIACEQPELVARVIRGQPARSEAAVTAVLQFLRDRGLLVAAPGPAGEPVWDLAHDSLVSQVEAWVTANDLSRRRALELVRYHLRRSARDAPSLLGVAELREVRVHLDAHDVAELDGEWGERPGVGQTPASRLLAASRRVLARRRAAFGGFALVAVAISAVFAQRWLEGRREIVLRDRDIGSSYLVLRAFDWDPVKLTAADAATADFSWKLVQPAADNPDLPEPSLPAEDLTSHPLAPPAGAVLAAAISARSGAAVLEISRRDRAGQLCSPVIVPIRRLPGYAQTRFYSLRIPTCEATRAGTLAVPAGPFLASGPGDPVSPEQEQERRPEREVSLAAYALDRTEVPNALLAAISGALALSERRPPVYPSERELARASEPDRPAASLDWFDAAAVCRLLGKRLPRSHEWQKAARGGALVALPGGVPERNPYPRRNLPWGPEPDLTRANVNGGGPTAPAAVGSFPRDIGPYGHLDLGGNVSEWTADFADQSFAIMRGGNWSETKAINLINFGAIENPRLPTFNQYTIGFRCAVDL